MVIRYKILILFLIAFSVVSVTSAHPGRTDKYGCHTCRTNCERWGLRYGEYHCHNTKNRIRKQNLNKNSPNVSRNNALSTSAIDDLLFETLKKNISDLQSKISILKARLDGLEKRLDFINSNYLVNLPSSKSKSDLIDLKDILRKGANDLKKSLDAGLLDLMYILNYHSSNYSLIKKVIDMENESLNDYSKRIDELSGLIDELEQLAIIANNFYSTFYNRNSYYNSSDYSKISACQQALNEVATLQRQVSNIRQQIMEEASKAGGLVTQSQLEEAVRFKAQDIYKQIDQKLLEIKTSGICD
jgi:Mg2+ and Co2+ transporter CorA